MKPAKIVETAQNLLEQGQFSEAIEALSALLSVEPDCVDAYLVRALASRKCGQMEASLQDYSRVIASDESKCEAFYGRGFVRIKLGAYESAIDDFSRVIELQPDEIGAYINRGNAKRKSGNPAQAVLDFEKALELDSSDHHARYGLAQAYDEQGEFNRAIDAFTSYLKIDSQNVDALFRRGVLFSKLEHFSEAARDFSRVLELDPDHKEATEYRVQTYARLVEHGDKGSQEKRGLAVSAVSTAVGGRNQTAEASLASLERYLQAGGSISAFVRLSGGGGQYSMFVVEYLTLGGKAGFITYLTQPSWFPPRRRSGEGEVCGGIADALALATKHGDLVLKTVWSPGAEQLVATARAAWSYAIDYVNDAQNFSSKESAVMQLRRELLKEASLARLDGRPPRTPYLFNLHEVNLANESLRGLNVSAVRFDQSDLRNSIFIDTVASKTSFSKSNLSCADFSGVKADDANFLEADMQEFVSTKGNFRGANFTGANLRGAKFEKADLQGANFQGAGLEGTLFKACAVNEKTLLPTKPDGYSGLVWKAVGRNPFSGAGYGRTGVDSRNLEDLLTSLQMHLDSSRLKKALSMLKSNPIELFLQPEPADGAVCGIIRSQTDESLIYGCYLDYSGTYFCCTQNLNVCGGQGDSVCKHLLVLVIGLAVSGTLPWGDAACMGSKAGRYEPRSVPKESMALLFKRFKQAEFGQVIWTPVETNPQDFKGYS